MKCYRQNFSGNAFCALICHVITLNCFPLLLFTRKDRQGARLISRLNSSTKFIMETVPANFSSRIIYRDPALKLKRVKRNVDSNIPFLFNPFNLSNNTVVYSDYFRANSIYSLNGRKYNNEIRTERLILRF